MKIIDLLNEITNGKDIPKKIKTTYGRLIEYYKYNSEIQWYETYDETTILTIGCVDDLKIKIEIIEDKPKKIEHIKKNQNRNDKINEIIDSVNYLLEKSKDNEI